MTITKEQLYTTIIPDAKKDFQSFFKQFKSTIDTCKKENLIVNLTALDLNLEELLLFADVSIKKIDLGTSFVVIKKDVDLDLIPDELIVVPTFPEAIDMIEMDEMTRSLDF
jgi:hypothetical protein